MVPVGGVLLYAHITACICCTACQPLPHHSSDGSIPSFLKYYQQVALSLTLNIVLWMKNKWMKTDSLLWFVDFEMNYFLCVTQAVGAAYLNVLPMWDLSTTTIDESVNFGEQLSFLFNGEWWRMMTNDDDMASPFELSENLHPFLVALGFFSLEIIQ